MPLLSQLAEDPSLRNKLSIRPTFLCIFFFKIRNITEMWVLLHTGYPQSEAPVTCLQRTEHLVLCTAAIIGLLLNSSKKVDHPGPTGAPGAFATVSLWAGTHQAIA